jgi:hypothetical protein
VGGNRVGRERVGGVVGGVGHRTKGREVSLTLVLVSAVGAFLVGDRSLVSGRSILPLRGRHLRILLSRGQRQI